MTELQKRTDYYEAFKGPDIYRIPLEKERTFALSLPGASIQAEFIVLESDTSKPIFIDAASSGWLYTWNGEGSLTSDTTFQAGGEDLFYLRQNATVLLASQNYLNALLVKTTKKNGLVSVGDRPRVTKLPERTGRTVDWVGEWLPEIADTSMHVGREGTNSLSSANPEAEVPFHTHEHILELYFTAQGRSIMNVRGKNTPGQFPMRAGDLTIITPHIYHGMGSVLLNRTYSGSPYKGFAVKIPYASEKVNAKDILLETDHINAPLRAGV